MIFAPLDGLSRYFPEEWWRKASAIIAALTPESPDGDIPVEGRDVFIRVLTYNTVTRDKAVLETHRSYVDIQLTLKGDERIAIWPAGELRVRTPYDPAKDAVYYEPSGSPAVELTLRPGFAGVFFPEDAHMPALIDEHPAEIRKVVVKVGVDRCSNARPV
jgi:YhcH/YjgK/YiaL family protein